MDSTKRCERLNRLRSSLYCSRACSPARLPGFFTTETSSKRMGMARAIPIRFEEVSVVKKPGKRAGEQAREQYREDRKRFNLSQRFVESMAQLRIGLDAAGGARRILVIAGDGSFC